MTALPPNQEDQAPAVVPLPQEVDVPVVVDAPAHAGLAATLTYTAPEPLLAGTLVRVPLGRRELLGVVWEAAPALQVATPVVKKKPISQVLEGISPLAPTWRALIAFTARYYQRSLGEVASMALPPQMKAWQAAQVVRKLRRVAKQVQAVQQEEAHALPAQRALEPTPEQAQALAAIAQEMQQAQRPILLFGATGSGKTEVYLHAAAQALAQAAGAQVLVLVPEINLTPQLLARFRARFAHLGADAVVSMHSGMTPAARSTAWLAAHTGRARVVLGTRLAVLTSLADVRLIVVDEEHDASYKAQDGARHSARDVAIYRAKLESERLQAAGYQSGCTLLLGSATPSLETWHAAEQGRYARVAMPTRVGAGSLPQLQVVDMRLQPKGTVIAASLMRAIAERVQRGEQTLLLLNRRGYAPVLSCNACGWKSECPHCSAFRVFHKMDRSLRCHHCGFAHAVPRACPECGNLDIAPVGRGTEKLEEEVLSLLAGVLRPDGQAAVVARMDADSTRGVGSLEQHLAAMHSGAVDVLVGTQMVAKGHDFRNITLVAALNPDGGLFAADFRAPERLFALLLQAAGRAGRDATLSARAQMWLQTYHPEHALYRALAAQDYPGFAAQQLAEREAAAMPPFSAQALLRAEGKTQAAAQAFLQVALDQASSLPQAQEVTLYAPVPSSMQRIANVERTQLLVEAPTRAQLQRFLHAWRAQLHGIKVTGLLRWALDVDPHSV